ncbi:MAG: alpha/beta hydrolase, partial [Sulfurovaceae bacterium]|nr:alpha/beta hydrolase [Sulfurovaceae bacterium]
MEKLQKEGYDTFLNQYFKKNTELFANLSKKQKPHTLMITCSDSRINPALLLNAHPGELFIARNIGNVVPPYLPAKGSTQAAIEYAVNALNIPKIVILGHSNCGACAHMYHKQKENDPDLPHVEQWLQYMVPAKNAAMLEVNANHHKNIFELTEKHNVVVSLQRLMEYPYIQTKL